MFYLKYIGVLRRGSPQSCVTLAERLTSQGAHQAALPLLAKAAEAGLSTACYRLGRAYLLGHGVPSAPATALRWIGRAARDGNAEAQTLLASLALQGLLETPHDGLFEAASSADRPPDFDIAYHWASQAGAQNCPEAWALMGYILTAGPDRLLDRAEGVRYYRKAAQAGCPQGALGLAQDLLRDNAPNAIREARGLLEHAASAGLPMAQFSLGVLDESGAFSQTEVNQILVHAEITRLLPHSQ